MLPLRRDTVDVNKSSPEDSRLTALYGKRPINRNLMNTKNRKYFDSGDYALSKAGRAPQSNVGTAIPNPANIPHASGLGNGYSNGHQIISISPTNSTNPVNIESSLANNENTRVPDKPGVEAVVNKTKTIEGTVTKNETAEDTSEDTKDTAEDTKDAAEDTKDTAEDTKDTTEDATENTTIESKVNITAAEIAI